MLTKRCFMTTAKIFTVMFISAVGLVLVHRLLSPREKEVDQSTAQAEALFEQLSRELQKKPVLPLDEEPKRIESNGV